MESPRKFNDCYFYYYSTCTKGDNCVFRHEPSALGCETMCQAWQQGKCLDKRCKLRHMELRKNRKQIPCYWENQPGGCRKKHCPFMHKNPEARTDGIAPSQPIINMPSQPLASMPDAVSAEQPLAAPAVAPVPAVQPVPLLWQQRQVVLDSAILGVLPASSDLLGGRRVLPPHEPPTQPYAPMPVDPLVVNFEEESDNESAPSTTPTKPPSADATETTGKSQELLLLEKIQAESAAYYNYGELPPIEHKERKIIRTNLSTKYDKVSLDELTGKKGNLEKKSAVDFKVLSLDEIRAKKRVVEPIPITLNLNRKRKLSSQETVIDSESKIIKLVRSNCIVYRKLDTTTATSTSQSKATVKTNEIETRKRTMSEQSDLEILDELDDECFKFKRIKTTELEIPKPTLIRTKHINTSTSETSNEIVQESKSDSDDEVQIIDENFVSHLPGDVIDLAATSHTVDVVNLSDDDDVDIVISDYELGLGKNVPDVVASCRKNKDDNSVIDDIDALLNEDL